MIFLGTGLHAYTLSLALKHKTTPISRLRPAQVKVIPQGACPCPCSCVYGNNETFDLTQIFIQPYTGPHQVQ